MPDYRGGIFLAPQDGNRKVHFGENIGRDVWQDAPGEHRANLRRIIVTQGDTEPASVEQQRHLGLTAPSQYDLRRSEEHTSELQSLMRISYAVFCLKKKNRQPPISQQ